MYEGNCYYPIRTPANKLYPSKQPYSLIILQQITYECICHHVSALHHVKIKFTKIHLNQTLENGGGGGGGKSITNMIEI